MRHVGQFAVFLFAFASFSSRALCQEPNGTDAFSSFSDLALGGTWSTSAANGETVEHTYSLAGSPHFLRIEMKGGPLPGMAVIGVERTTGECMWWGFLSDGNTVRSTLKLEKEGVWLLESSGEGAVQYKGRVSRVDDDTIKEEVLRWKVGGVAQEPQTSIWKREK